MQQAPRRRSSLQEDAVEAPPQLPLTDGRHFACRRCRRILSEAQWYATGCVDCSATMGVPDRDSLLDFATPHFHNFIGLIAPGQSWVARLIMKSRAPTNGVFAEKLSDDEVEEEEEGDDVLTARDVEDHYDDGDDAEDGEKDADVVEVAETPAAAAAGGVAPSHDDEGDDDLEGILPASKAPSSSAMAAAEAARQPAEPAVSAEDNAVAPEDEASELKRVKLEVDHDAMRRDGSA